MSQENPYAATEIDDSFAPRTPLTVGGTLRAAVDILTERFSAICLVVVGCWLPAELLSSYATYELIDEEMGSSPLILDQLFELLVGSLVAGAVIHLSNASLSKKPMNAATAIGRAMKTWPLLIANRILTSIVCTLGFVLLIVPGLYLMIRLTLVDVVSVLEKQGGTDSLSRSFELTKPHFGYTFLMCCFFFLGSASFIVLMLVPQSMFPDLDTWYVDALATTLYDVVASFFQICSVVMWNDMRQTAQKAPFHLRVPMQ